MTDSITRLAQTINKRIHAVSDGKIDTIAEIGEIGSGHALYVSSMEDRIPRSQYSIIGGLKTPKIGDEVLVIWADEEPVIIGKAKTGTDGGDDGDDIESITKAEIDALFDEEVG